MKLKLQLHHYFKAKHARILFSFNYTHRVESVARVAPYMVKLSKVQTWITSHPPSPLPVKRQSKKSRWTLTDPLT